MNNKSLWWSKLTYNAGFQTVTFFVTLTLVILGSLSMQNYGWQYVINPQFTLPSYDYSVRAWMMFFVAIFAFQTAYNIYLSYRLKKLGVNLFTYSIGIFTWLFTPYLIIQYRKFNYHEQLRKYLNKRRPEGLQISNKYFKNVIKGHEPVNKLFFNTCLAYVLAASTIVGFIIIFYKTDTHTNIPGMEWLIFKVFTFFTQLSNLACFGFIMLFLVFHKKNVFRQNTVITYLTAYILVVAIVYWAYLFPLEPNMPSYDLFRNVILHAVTPLLFTIFCISCYFQNYVMPKKQLWSYIGMGCVFPLTYGLYAYSLPFVIHFSVYSALTNLNGEMLNAAGETMGNPLMVFGLLALVVLFCAMFLLLRYCNFRIANKKRTLAKLLASKNAY